MKSIFINLDPEKDVDIIEFMKDKPRTYTVKTAIRHYMNIEKGSIATTNQEATPSTGENESVFGGWAPQK